MPYCTICGVSKTHYRTSGYRCHHHDHAQQESAQVMSAIQRGQDPDVICPRCEYENYQSSEYCTKCGKRLPKDESVDG